MSSFEPSLSNNSLPSSSASSFAGLSDVSDDDLFPHPPPKSKHINIELAPIQINREELEVQDSDGDNDEVQKPQGRHVHLKDTPIEIDPEDLQLQIPDSSSEESTPSPVPKSIPSTRPKRPSHHKDKQLTASGAYKLISPVKMCTIEVDTNTNALVSTPVLKTGQNSNYSLQSLQYSDFDDHEITLRDHDVRKAQTKALFPGGLAAIGLGVGGWFLGGAISGSVIPGLGTIIGGVVGLIVGGIAAYKIYKEAGEHADETLAVPTTTPHLPRIVPTLMNIASDFLTKERNVTSLDLEVVSSNSTVPSVPDKLPLCNSLPAVSDKVQESQDSLLYEGRTESLSDDRLEADGFEGLQFVNYNEANYASPPDSFFDPTNPLRRDSETEGA